MSIAVSEEHELLAGTVRRWLSVHCTTAEARAALSADPGELPAVWERIGGQGWLGVHLPERHGGQGFGLGELAIVLAEFGHALAPGPVLPTAITSAVVARLGNAEQCDLFLPGLGDGSTPAGVSFGGDCLGVEREEEDGGLLVSGTLRTVLGGAGARLVLAPLSGRGWCLLDLERPAPQGIVVEALDAVDGTRSIGRMVVDRWSLPSRSVLGAASNESVLSIALVLSAAENAGCVRWCLEIASQYAKDRQQFGRPIGQFQGVKHKLADMLVATEQADAVAWDAARAYDGHGVTPDLHARSLSLVAAMAASVSLHSFAQCAKACVQVLGGIGFTWEHDAQLFLKRSLATSALIGTPDAHAEAAARLALDGARRPIAADLPTRAEGLKEKLAPLVAALGRLDGEDRAEHLVDQGWAYPHWPAPWGRDADPLEQLVIQRELRAAGISGRPIGVGAWALPTLIAHGTDAQQHRWIRDTLLGKLIWCQLFSEPGAGSDLAALSTRAERVQGGWLLTGQKLWTSHAHQAQWGICLARSDPSVPKHQGITYFIVDMASEGIDIRPLRDLTGEAEFNEVFLDRVFVPDDAVVGVPGDGWRIARTTLANERVSMSSSWGFGAGVEQLLRMLSEPGAEVTPVQLLRVGELLAEGHSLALIGHRTTLRALAEMDPGAGSSVGKLLGAEHEQRVQELGLALSSTGGAVRSGEAEAWVRGVLVTRCLTIAGGTSEVQRNLIAERLLGQPRDPEPTAPPAG